MDVWWSGALSAGDGSGEQPPAWADFVDSVLSLLPVSGVVPGARPRGVEDFAELMRPFAEYAVAARAEVRVGGLAEQGEGVRAAFVRRLSRGLGQRCARVLVLELNVARVTGRLVGDTPSERFRDFVAGASRREVMASILSEYPVLGRLIGQFCLHAVSAFDELLRRFEDDRAEIVATLLGGVEPGALVAVDTGAGDRHRLGRSVAVLRFADGRRVVYKPTALGIHQHFNDVARWLSDQPGVSKVPVLNLVVRDGYGWVEHAGHRPCATEGELERFYVRQGVLLALLHVLGGTDLHFENLIARGDEPVLIDLEALFHPLASVHAVADPASVALRSSVYRTGLLPHLFLGDQRAVDASGLGGDPGALSPADSVDWADPGTDLMRLIRRPGTLAGAANRPTPSGERVEPAEHIDALLAGFRAGYQAIVAGRDVLLGPRGLLQAFAQDEARVLMRSTQTYATLLAEATHPDVLRDAAAKDALLGLLAAEPLAVSDHPAILEQELAQLWEDDVPLFTAQPGSRDLWSGTGARIPDVLDRSSLDLADERIRGMGDADRELQEWITRAAMAARSSAQPHRPPGVSGAAAGLAPVRSELDSERLLDAARDIGDRLVYAAHSGGGRINWLGLELLGDRYWQLRPCGADLGGGYSGVGLFLAQLAGLTGADRYAEAARSALRPLSAVLERLEAEPEAVGAVGAGGFAGLGGIAYGVTVVSQVLDDSDIRALINPATALTVRAAASGRATTGVAEGLAGGLAALLAVHRATGADEAWRGAVACAAELVARPLPAEAGMRCGAAGVGWALLGFAEAGGGAEYEEAGLAALRTASSRVSGDSWCAGLPGVALAIADRAAALADEQLASAVQNALRELKSAPLGTTDHSLCHGEMGRLELLARLSDDAAREALNRRAEALLAALELDGPRCGAPDDGLTVPGLLAGLAGVGHGLLRLAIPEQTPPALLLRTGS